MTKLLAMTGAKRSGKNTVADIVSMNYKPEGANIKLVSFARPLKVAAARAIGFSGEEEHLVDLMDKCKEEWEFGVTGIKDGEIKFFSGREYLQWFGTEAVRQTFGENFWIDQTLPDPLPLALGAGWADSAPFEALARAYPDTDLVVVTDLRFLNEAQRVKALGGTVWETTREGTSGNAHASEAPLPRDLVDLTIPNDGTLEDLQATVELALMSL